MELKKYLNLQLETFAKKGSFNKRIANFFTSGLFWILIIGGAFRLLYYSFLADKLCEDSPSYLNDHSNIFKGQINIFRTPVYPYFIKFIRLFSEQALIKNIIIAQSIISFCTIIIFYKILSNTFKNRKVITAATLVYATMLPIVNFDKVIITESLSICCILIFISLIVSYLKKQTIAKAVTISMYTFFAILLRPSFIALLPIILFFWTLRFIFYKKDWKICLFGFATSIAVILLIHGYCLLNERENGFYGISSVTNANQLENIVSSNMYMQGNDPELSNLITTEFNRPMTPRQHWNTIEKILRNHHPQRIADFISNCIKHQPNIFFKRVLNTTMVLQTNNIFVNYADKKEGILPRLVIDLQLFVFFTTFNKLTIFLLFDFTFIVFIWIKTKRAPWLSIVLWLIIVAQIAVAIIGAQSDYQRLILAAIPCIIIAFFTYIDRVCHAIDINRLKNYPPSI